LKLFEGFSREQFRNQRIICSGVQSFLEILGVEVVPCKAQRKVFISFCGSGEIFQKRLPAHCKVKLLFPRVIILPCFVYTEYYLEQYCVERNAQL